MNKKIYLLLFTILLVVYSCIDRKENAALFPRTNLEFYILESNYSEGSYLSGNLYDQHFIKYDYKELSNEWPNDNRMITLRVKLKLESCFKNQDIYLVVLPTEYPCQIYFNQNQLAIRGDYKNGYTNRLHYSEKILIPNDKINYNSNNEIAFQLYPKEGETYPFSLAFISNSKDASKYVFFRNLLGSKLISALSLCGFVFFLYFLITYLTRREYQKQHFLFFALMNLFFVISYVNNVFTYDFSNTFLLEKISRLGFPLAVFVGICFMLEYTNVFKKKRILKIAFLLFFMPAIIMLILPNTTTKAISAYNSYPLISLFVGNLMLLLLALLYFLKEKNLKSTILLLIFLINNFAGLHDGYYFAILHMKPFVLLTPVTVFGINLTIFIILAVDHSILYHVALRSSEKLEVMNQELELLVEKRTQKTIEYANKLEEANSTKDKFFSIIAHDLKNPFNTLIGYSDVLRTDFRDYGQDEILQQLNVIYNTSINGYNLLDNLLKWSQSQTNKILFEPQKINLREIVQLCIEDIEDQSLFKDIDIVNDVTENFHLIADENLLKTILRNLINNAVKFTHRNGMVSVSCKKDDTFIEISVKDTGIGMSEMELQNIFQIDRVSSKPGTNKEKGSGLGLILCKEFIEKHGGKIWVESNLDVGSIFRFSIPKIISN